MAGVNNIIAAGFGSWSTVEFVPTLGFGISTAAVYVPTIHFHTLEGPTKLRLLADGPSKERYALTGVPRTFTLDGSD